ncbi:HutD/Ves family protein [Muricoccus pecuniae]|uniref:HutD family protein n=1 Tax=Muricoccus pecuniae TaxID=693023 RepID=A0A840Y0K5_9PROT|nr:HutD family protein [Roseomonas pecuniae]MBB5694638.1 hypothetical protein [Roseomonas pecuniae]
MTLRLIRAAGLRPRPWPNGLGTTRDVAEGPGWLIGIADLGGEAAFSHFPETDRIFTPVAGEGGTLTLEGHPIPCRPLVPVLFPGDRPAHYVPAGGPGRAFNLFIRRGAGEGRVQACRIAASHGARLPGTVLALFCAEGVLDVGGGRLEAGDTLLHPGATALRAPGGPAAAIIVEWLPVG